MAYNLEEKEDFTIAEYQLWLGLAYAYEWYRANPDDKDSCQELMESYIEFYEGAKDLNWDHRPPEPSWIVRAREEKKAERHTEQHTAENTEQKKEQKTAENAEENKAPSEAQKGSV